MARSILTTHVDDAPMPVRGCSGSLLAVLVQFVLGKGDLGAFCPFLVQIVLGMGDVDLSGCCLPVPSTICIRNGRTAACLPVPSTNCTRDCRGGVH